MKAEKIICVTANGDEEKRFIYKRFLNDDYSLVSAHTTEFYFDLRYEKEVYKAIDEWDKRSKK